MKFRILHNKRVYNKDDINSNIQSHINYFQNIGIKKDQHIAINSENSLQYVFSIFALIEIGAIIIPINTRYSNQQIKASISKFSIDLIISNIELDNEQEYFNFPKYDSSLDPEQDYIEILQNPSTVLKEQITNVILSSGSTGEPKGVVHNYNNHFSHAGSSNTFYEFSTKDSWLLSLPLFHVGGFSILFKCLLANASLNIPVKLNDMADEIINTNTNCFSFVFTQYQRLIKNPNVINKLKTSKVILLGGSAIPESLITFSIDNDLPIRTSYGMSEMSSQIATSKYPLNIDSSSSQVALPNVEIIISDKKEILVKGEMLFKGYYTNRTLLKELTINGFFATGDIGEYSEDNGLKITGRIDNMFISGGENIHPENIERIISKTREIDKCLVVPKTNSEFGHIVSCVIKTSSHFDIKKFHLKLIEKLSKYEKPKRYYQYPEIEEGIKLDRKKVIQLVNDDLLTELLY
ncbi:o-succinylbenzoate--CoA ligase [Candidatus Kapabacteria bacterium]|nr:o-succinylbenzoate--CoA ligase [Candidatus Kapabacteria bacterium]